MATVEDVLAQRMAGASQVVLLPLHAIHQQLSQKTKHRVRPTADATVYAAACCEAILMSAMKTAAALALDPANDRYRRGTTKRHERVPAAFLQLALRVDPLMQELWRDWLSLQQLAALFLDSHAAEQLEADGHEVGEVITSPGDASVVGFGESAGDSAPVRVGQRIPKAASSGRGVIDAALDIVEEQASEEEAETSLSLSHQDGEAAAAASASASAAATAAASGSGSGASTGAESPGTGPLGLPEDAGMVHDLSQRRWARRAGDAITEVEASQLLTAAHPALTADNNFALLAAAIARELLHELCRRSGIGAKLPEEAQAAIAAAAAAAKEKDKDKTGAAGLGIVAPPPPGAEANAHKVAAAATAWLPPLARQLCEKAGRHAVSAFAMVWKAPERIKLRVTWVKGAPGTPAQVGGSKTTAVTPEEDIGEACRRVVGNMRVDPGRATLLWRGTELPKLVANPLSTEEAIRRLEEASAAAAAESPTGTAPPVNLPPTHVPPNGRLLLLGDEMEVFAVEKRWWEHRRREAARRGMLTSTRNQSSQVRHIRKTAESKVRRMREWADGVPTPPKPHDSSASPPGRARRRKKRDASGEGPEGGEGKALYEEIHSSGYGQEASPAKPNRWAKMRQEEEAKAAESGGAGRDRSRLRRPGGEGEGGGGGGGSAKASPRAGGISSSGYGAGSGTGGRRRAGKGSAGDPDVRAARALLRSCVASQPLLEAALQAVKELRGTIGTVEGLEEAAASEDATAAAGVKEKLLASLAAGDGDGGGALTSGGTASESGKVSSLLHALQEARATMDTALRVAGKVQSRGLLGTKR